MKFSQYNLTDQIEGNTVIYNSISGGVLVLNPQYTEMYNKLVEDCDFDRIEDEFRENLQKGNMIMPNDIDELEMLTTQNMLQRYSSKHIGFTIAPTLMCNFRCPYCYEQGRNYNTMSDETVNRTIQYINESAKGKEGLSVVWYGGEPLLAVDIIERITAGIENKEALSYSASMVTNGYLLTKEIALKLKQLNVRRAQVTIDGPPHIHNQRRRLPNGNDTFFVILNNIKEACEIIPINIRVNVDKNNINEVDDILKYIDDYGLRNKVGFYLAPVDDINDACNASGCFSGVEFSEEQIEFYLRNQRKGYFFAQIPRCSPGICGAVSISSMIIDPLGHLYKCWDEIGDVDAKVGDIREKATLNMNYTKWLNYKFLTKEECKTCKALPVCLGGCPYKYIKTGERRCHPTKYNAHKLVELVYSAKNNTPVKSQ